MCFTLAGMDVALYLSIGSVIIAAGSAWFTATSAQANKAMARANEAMAHTNEALVALERERRHDEQKPHLHLLAHDWGRQQYLITISNNGPMPLDSTILRKLPPRKGEPKVGAFRSGNDLEELVDHIELGPLEIGAHTSAVFSLSGRGDDDVYIQFSAMCRRGDEEWTLLLSCRFKESPVREVRYGSNHPRLVRDPRQRPDS